MFQVNIDLEAMRPVIEATVSEVLAQLERDRAAISDRMAFCEPEAARELSMESHQLRDERLRGRISASVIVGKRIRYTRQDLLDYLARGRIEASQRH